MLCFAEQRTDLHVSCPANVCDDSPTLKYHCFNVSCWLGVYYVCMFLSLCILLGPILYWRFVSRLVHINVNTALPANHFEYNNMSVV